MDLPPCPQEHARKELPAGLQSPELNGNLLPSLTPHGQVATIPRMSLKRSRLTVHLIRHSLCHAHSCNPSRLGTSHHLSPQHGQIRVTHKLGYLRRLARSRLTFHNGDLILAEHREELLHLLIHGETFALFEDFAIRGGEWLQAFEGVYIAILIVSCLQAKLDNGHSP